MSDGNTVIVFTERGRLVDNTGTLVGLDIRVVEHAERPILELCVRFQVRAWNYHKTLSAAPAP